MDIEIDNNIKIEFINHHIVSINDNLHSNELMLSEEQSKEYPDQYKIDNILSINSDLILKIKVLEEKRTRLT